MTAPTRPRGMSRAIAHVKLIFKNDHIQLIFLALFTITFGLNTDYTIDRTMKIAFPRGVGHFIDDGLAEGLWRLVSLSVCAAAISVLFVHSCIRVMLMRLTTSIWMTYLKVFFIFYLSVSPWLALHISRLFLSVFVDDVGVIVDVIFVSIYAGGFLTLNYAVMPIAARLLRNRP